MKTIKHGLLILALVLTANVSGAATNEVGALLQKGLFEEEANRNLDAAIQAYQSVVAQTDKDRKFAATAIFRLGECYRKQGKTNEATAQYERIVREFADQAELVQLSRSYVSIPAIPAALSYQGRKDSNQNLVVESTVPTTSEEAEEIKRIQMMIKNSPDLINALDGSFSNPLLRAAAAGQLTVAKFLLESKAEVNKQGWAKKTPLHLAVEAGHKAMVELLLANGAAINALNGVKETPLHLAAKSGFIGVAEVLIAKGADVKMNGRAKRTPLHEAVAQGSFSIVKMLIEHKAEVNAKDENGETPLMAAVNLNSAELVKLLLEHGADVNARKEKIERGESREWAALHFAVRNQRGDIVKILLENKANPNLKLTFISPEPNPSQPGSFQSVPHQNFTPLHIAVYYEQKEIAELLLAYKAAVDERDGEGKTPLVIAVQKNSKELCELLLKNKADINVLDNYKETPLSHAVGSGTQEVVELLVNHGANLNHRAQNGYYPLTYALTPNKFETAKFLILHGADVNAPGGNEQTPLDQVSYSRNDAKWTEDITKLLKEHGAISFLESSTIRVKHRDRTAMPVTFFTKDKASLNHYTLFELLTVVFPLDIRNSKFAFPDFDNMTIERKGEREKIKLELAIALQMGDCSKNVPLEWGDILEIPELDHKLAESWTGFSARALKTLEDCLIAKVEIVVKGQTNAVILEPKLEQGATLARLNEIRAIATHVPIPAVQPAPPASGTLSNWVATFSNRVETVVKEEALKGSAASRPRSVPPTRGTAGVAEKTAGIPIVTSYRLYEVLHDTGVILASSDLSRVKVRRMNPTTKKKEEMIFNLVGASNNQVATVPGGFLPPVGLPIPARAIRQPVVPRETAVIDVITDKGSYDSNEDLWLRDGDVIEIPEKQ